MRVLPATSVQMPVTEAVAESGPEYEPPVQLPIPETASVAEKPTPRERLYQPFVSGPRAGAATGAVGGVLSIRTVTTGLVTVPHVNVAVHWRVVVPSTLISSAAGQPVVSTRSVGSIVHRIVTLLVYQLFVPAVPVSVKLIGAAAPGAAFARITLTRASTQIGKHNRRSDDPARAATRAPPRYLLILNVLEPRTRPYVGRSSVPVRPRRTTGRAPAGVAAACRRTSRSGRSGASPRAASC